MKRLLLFINDTLYQPQKVFKYALGFVFVTMLLNGSFYRLWSLHTDQQKIHKMLAEEQVKIDSINSDLNRAKDPSFMERTAIDRYDLVEKDDLVFIFADE